MKLLSDPSLVVPMVTEATGYGERAYDIYSLLLRNRSYFWAARSTTGWRMWWWRSCST
jgi:hypothetical protein